MFSSAEKTPKPVSVQRQQNVAGGSFFRKAGEESFFGKSESSSFFSAPIQAKLQVSSPDDPQEKEADAVADKVMRMEEPVADLPLQGEKLQRKEEEKDSSLGASQSSFLISKKSEEEQDKIQTKLFSHIHRQLGPGGFSTPFAPEAESSGADIQAKLFTVNPSQGLQGSARGPPSGQFSASSFENSLSATKGGGISLPSDTRLSMESRFGADFSGVRIHTGSYAETLSRSINAQAFTHGNDIYFNSGKFSPTTTGGSTLLAHELTHTIQQGASQPVSGSVTARKISRMSISRQIQRVAESQRTAAVEFAKAEQGKVSANKEGPDGNRMGWERLLEYFKTSFGPEKILPEGAAYQTGAVSEGHIRKKSTFLGNVMDPGNGTTVLHNQPRDAMPSWCGIFAFWALNKGGIPLKKWELGGRMIPAEAVYPRGYEPKPGDIAYRQEFSHYALVASSDGSSVTSINGNTAGDDNVGGEVQVQTHPKAHWFAFFDPTQMMDGALRNPGTPGPGAAPVRSLAELRKKLFNVQRQAGPDAEKEKQAGPEGTFGIQPKTDAAAVHPSAGTEPGHEIRKEESQEQEIKKSGGSASDFDIHRSYKGGEFHQQEATVQRSAEHSQTETSLTEKEEKERSVPEQSMVQRQEDDKQDRGPPSPTVQLKVQPKLIQRSWLGDAWNAVTSIAGEAAQWVERGLDAAKEWLLGKVSDFVSNIPGYSLLRILIGHDPVTGRAYPMNGTNLLNAGLDALGSTIGRMYRALMQRLGIFQDVAIWLQGRITDISGVVGAISARFVQFWDSLTLDDAGDPQGVINRVAELLRSTIRDIVSFVERAARDFLEMIKRVMIREISAFVRKRIPRLFPLLSVALGFNPETLETVERNGTNILNALLEATEDGREQRRQMTETGTFQRIAGWIDRGIGVFSQAYQMLRQAIYGIWDFVTVENLFHPVDTMTRLWNQFSAPVILVGKFIIDAAREILKVIKNALMQRLSEHAKQTRGFTLITVIIGRDPFTDQRVPFTMENVIKGFFSLMDGGEQQYNQLKESGAIDRTVNKITAAVARLNMTPQAIIQLFIDIWNSLTLRQLANPVQAFRQVVATFGRPIARLIAFIIEIIMIVVEAILTIMKFPFDLISNIIAKARLAFELIKRDPAGFLKNLLRAVKQGFTQFFGNILTHLFNGLKNWFLSEVQAAGIPVPTDFSVMGIIRWLLVVLDITMEKIWKKLEDRIGKPKVDRIRRMIEMAERVAGAAGEAYEFIRDVQQRGFMAVIIDKIKEQLSNVWEMVLQSVQKFVMEQIISKVTAKLLSMLDPTGIMAVINSAIAIYNAIQSFIRYLTEMLQIVNSFVEGTVEIARGSTKKAADFLEGALARGVPVVIGFLANQVGLNLSERLKDGLEFVREKVDQGLTWVIDRLVTIVERLVSMGRNAVNEVMAILGLRETFRTNSNETHNVFYKNNAGTPVLTVASREMTVPDKLNYLKTQKLPSVTDQNERNRLSGLITEAEGKVQVLEPMKEDIRKSNMKIKPLQSYEITAIEKRMEPHLRRIAAIHKELFDALGYDEAVFGPGVNIKTDDPVITLGPPAKSYRVKATKLFNASTQKAYLEAEAPDSPGKTYLFYDEYKVKWDNPTVPAFTGCARKGAGSIVTIDKANLGKPGLGKEPGVPDNIKAKFYHGIWLRAGHLVAKEFGGGSYSDGNIVPMTIKANHESPGMREIEIKVSTDIKTGAVYNYEVQPSSAVAPGALPGYIPPPAQVFVTAKRLYPSANPPHVPLLYTVDNTK